MKKITTFITLLFFIFHSYGQWTSDTAVNTLVADSESGDIQAVGTSDGKTYVVFWKSVPAPQFYEIRVQLLDAEGMQLFGPDGMLVSDDVPMSSFTAISSITIDNDDNLYIGATGTEDSSAWVFKINMEGNHLWGTNGVQVGNGNVVTILPLSNGEAIVSWFPAPQALMQRLDASGNTVWDTPQPVVNGGSSTVPSEMFELSNGDYIMIFHNVLPPISSYLYAQRYNSDGEAQWGSATQLANRATAFIRTYSKAQDGDVIYFGYYASAGVRFDSYLQRINADGTLPWGINGADFDTNETNYEMDTSIAFAPGSSYVWSVCTYTDNTQNLRGEYIQKFDKETGQRQFTDNAKQLYALSNEPNVHAGDLQVLNKQPFFLIKSGFDSGVSPVTLHALYLDENGDFAWEEETKPIATYAASKGRIQFTRTINGQSVAVFIENKGAGTKIYAQNIVEEDLSISDSENAVSVYYNNPVGNELTIQSNEAIGSVIIFDALGRKVSVNKFDNVHNIRIATASWKSGIYFMNITTNRRTVKGYKLVK